MMNLVLDYYDHAMAALDKGVSVEKLVDLEVREQIGRFKYIHDTDLKEAYNKVVEQLVSELAGLTAKEDR
jgi:V/A-type H+-transporting ATPase subunit A